MLSQTTEQQQLAKPADSKSVKHYVFGSRSQDIDSRHVSVIDEYSPADRGDSDFPFFIVEHWSELPSHVRSTIVSIVEKFAESL